MKVKPMKKRNRIGLDRLPMLSVLLVAAICIFGFATQGHAQVIISGLPKGAKVVPRTVEVIHLKITPSKEPVPAFKHRLSILPHHTIVGNAATHYLRSFGENSLEGPIKWAEKKFGFEEFHNVWIDEETPLASLPLENVREASSKFDHYIQNHIDRASRCRQCDWGLGERDLTGKQVFDFLLPSMQQTRQISRVLALQTRLAVVEKRFEDAIELMRMNYQLGQDVAEIDNLVCQLIGTAHIHMANRGMLDFVAASDSPNMYWALTELPNPIIDVRDSLRLEMQTGIRILTLLKDVESATHTDEEWSRLANEAAEMVSRIQSQMSSNYNWKYEEHETSIKLTTAGFSLMAYGPAKKRLVGNGYTKEEVEEMAVGQVLLIDAAREYQTHASEVEKSIYFPFQISKALNRSTNGRFNQATFSSPGQVLAAIMTPATEQIIQSVHRVQREINVLRLIEAIRMHVAVTGKLPADLGEIKVVPLPINSMSGKQFEYRLEGETGMIDLPKSDGTWRGKRYVISLK